MSFIWGRFVLSGGGVLSWGRFDLLYALFRISALTREPGTCT